MFSLHFIRPEWLLLLPVALLIGYAFFVRVQEKSGWRKVCSAHLLPYLLTGKQQAKKRGFILVSVFTVIALLALSGPSTTKQQQPVYRSSNTRVVVIDLSIDGLATDLKPNRLQRIKFKLNDLFQQLPEGYTGLIAYADAPYIVAPPTHDLVTLNHLLGALQPDIMPSNGYAAPEAIKQAIAMLKHNHAHDGTIIWFSASPLSPGIREAIAAVKQAGVRLYIVGAASAAGAPIPTGSGFVKNHQGNLYLSQLDEETLSKLAREGGGFYQRLQTTDQDLQYLLPALTTKPTEAKLVLKRNANLWLDQGFWLIIFILPISGYFLWRGRII